MAPTFQLPELTVPAERLAGRRSLLDQVGRQLEHLQRDSAVASAIAIRNKLWIS